MAKPATSVALLWGEDDYLLREAALQIAGDRRVTEVDAAEWQGSELQDLATPSLFGEPAWDLLLTLFIARDDGRAVTLSEGL